MGANAEPLRPCRNTFTHQHGLPCSHYIAGVIERGETLKKEEIHTRW